MPHGVLLTLLIPLLLPATPQIPGACVSAQTAPPHAPRGRAPDPPYYTDARFDKPLQFGDRQMRGPRVVEVLSGELGASVMVESPFLRRAIDTELSGKPAREAMDWLARTYRARWQKVGEIYVFVADERLSTAMNFDVDERARNTDDAFRALYESLLPVQVKSLRATGRLALGQGSSTPAQQALLRELGMLAIADPEIAAAPEVLEGRGLSLKVARDQDGPCVELWVPVNPSRAVCFASRALPAN